MADIGFRPTAKLIILSYKDAEDPVPAGPPFVAMYNPSTFSFQRGQTSVEKHTTQIINGVEVETKISNNSTLNVDLFFDGTGASPPLGIPSLGNSGPVGATVGAVAGLAVSALGVDALIKLFFKSTLESDNDVHTSRCLKLIWGAGLFFKCKLDDATVNYTLINRAGLPLRATVSARFTATESSSLLSKLLAKFKTSDITKLHTVKAGDTIYNIAKNEYDDESCYLQIAQANDLKNYRRLKPGMQLILPPIKKDE